MTFPGIAELASARGILEPADLLLRGQWQFWLDDVESQIRRRIPDLFQRIDTDADFARDVKFVAVAAVCRKIDNPQGFREIGTKIDDGQVNRVIDHSRTRGEVYITEDEWERLIPCQPGFAFVQIVGRPDGPGRYRGSW